MAPAFGRSISFPLSPSRSSTTTKKQQARHVRSISLPTCRAHPLLAHLHATTRAVRSWSAGADPCTTATSTPSAGLAHLDALHAALADLLVLPEPRAALASATAFSDRLLDALLAIADAHGAFRETLVDLRRHAAEAQAALRRRDAARLASAVRAQRGAEKDLARLASSARAASKLPLLLPAATATVAEVEVSGVLAEALAAAASASAAVFAALEAVSCAATSAAASASSKKPATLMSLVTRTSKAAASDEDRELAALEKMEQLDECIAEMESGGDKVFRSILHTRVALLNIRTQTC